MPDLPANCPPANARAHIGVIYRFVKAVDLDSFRSHYVLYPGKDWGDKLCEALGLSVCVSIADALDMQKKVPGMSKKKVAVAILDGTCGDVARTGTTEGHHAWWPASGFNFVSAFTIEEAA